MIEGNAEIAQVFAVGRFQTWLGWRQRRSLRIKDQVEAEIAAGQAIAQRVKPAQSADTGIKHALAALAIDVIFQITWQRSDNFDLLSCKKLY